MQVFEELPSLRQQILAWKQAGYTVGFVPTMGNLHAGHLSLVNIAQQRCDKVIVSVFVNPMQFGPNEDFERYPRTFEDDQKQLLAKQVDALFYPSVETMYPSGMTQTKVVVPESLTGLLEGTNRPGHFDGVTTVVTKLFNMVQPDVAVFGQKDYQQLSVIKAMVKDLAMPIDIVAAPIGRDIDGLALSSRNQYLSTDQRQIAPHLYRVIQNVVQAIQSGRRDYAELTAEAERRLVTLGFDSVDYLSVCHADNLLPATHDEKEIVILVVARIDKIRLLDNILLRV